MSNKFLLNIIKEDLSTDVEEVVTMLVEEGIDAKEIRLALEYRLEQAEDRPTFIGTVNSMSRLVSLTADNDSQHSLGLMYEKQAEVKEDNKFLTGAEIWVSLALESFTTPGSKRTNKYRDWNKDLRRIEKKLDNKEEAVSLSSRPTHELTDMTKWSIERKENPSIRPSLKMGKQGNFRLSDEEIATIRYMFEEEKMSQLDIAKKTKIHRATIGKVVRYESRKGIKPENIIIVWH